MQDDKKTTKDNKRCHLMSYYMCDIYKVREVNK